MDPNETLRLIRQLIRGIKSPNDDFYFLAEYVSALDNWLCNGGFLPNDWDLSQGIKSSHDYRKAKR